MRKSKSQTIMFVTYTCILLLLIIKSIGVKRTKPVLPTYTTNIPPSVTKPKDFADNKRLSKSQKEYYDYLYNKTE